MFSANSSATPALRGNEVSMDTIDLGNSESLVCGVFPKGDPANKRPRKAHVH
ncbi:DUF1391 family protein [Escherichia coli]